MKAAVKIFSRFLILLMTLILSCQKEFVEPADDTKGEDNGTEQTDVIVDGKGVRISQNGIIIEYCLLNEAGQPDTVFSEGENFRFYLAITDSVEPDTSMFIVSDFLRNPDLFKVFTSSGDTVGKPVDWCVMEKCSDAFNDIYFGNKWIIKIPWHETRGTEIPFNFDNLIRVFQHFFIGLNQPSLPKGEYYTAFTQQFCLGRHADSPVHNQEPFVCTDTLQLRINFEIK